MTFPGLLTRSLSMYTEEGIAEAIGAMKVEKHLIFYKKAHVETSGEHRSLRLGHNASLAEVQES